MEHSFGVRKGAWTEEEDILLRRCVEKYGEGKWFQIPHRAGLNRCRKSCRMRWLNYLKPNIKRGNFAADEVDLIIRLHKLLDNRWSLIAGRLPGRTANDVKNFWNSHSSKKKETSSTKDVTKEKAQDILKVKVIKPRPRTFSKKFTWVNGKPTPKSFEPNDNTSNISPTLMSSKSMIKWWEYLLDDKEDDKRATCSGSGLDKEPNKDLWVDIIAPEAKVWNIFYEDDPNCLADISFDISLWNFLNAE